MADIRIVRNEKGLTALRKSDAVNEFIKAIADDIAVRCGDGYEADLYTEGHLVTTHLSGRELPKQCRTIIATIRC